MKWYTGQVSENSEICFNTLHNDNHDLLYGYISTHSSRDVQLLFARLQASNDIRIHTALDDIRSRVAQFDASKSSQDVHVFMRYLESRLRDLQHTNEQRYVSNGGISNGHTAAHREPTETMSNKSRASSTANVANRETPSTLPRQYGRQNHRSSSNLEGGTNGGSYLPLAPPRRASQTSANQGEPSIDIDKIESIRRIDLADDPTEFDDMLNTVLGLQKKGATVHVSQIYPSSSTTT
jgi:hypothetical protein